MKKADEAPDVKAPEKPAKMFPVKLLKGYVPAGPYAVMRDGQRVDVTPPSNNVSSVYDKVERGATIELTMDEAKTVIANKIGERADGMDGIS